MKFFLGTHRPGWLTKTSVPLFVSRRTMPKRDLPRALGSWALDSGGFSELSLHGKWETSPWQYAAEVRRYHAEIGGMEWAAIQDWMCEPFVLAKTGLDVATHQRLTIESYLRLKSLAPEIPWAPVLQGWTFGQYERHAEAYARAGVDLRSLPAVGVGSICRRQNTLSAVLMLQDLRRSGFVNLHGFGLKSQGLASLVDLARSTGAPVAVASADSLAWSYQARRERPLPECRGHINCANCLPFALDWRDRLLATLERAGREPVNGALFSEEVKAA